MKRLPADLPPDSAKTYKRLRWVVGSGHDGNPLLVKAWRGRQTRPFAFLRFRTSKDRDRWIAQQKAQEDEHEQMANMRKAKRAEKLKNMQEKIRVGTILHYSWGYEQTNCEFWQVVERQGLMVTIRRIGSREVPGSQRGMSELRKPNRDVLIADEPPLRKRITECGLSMDHGIASPCGDDDQFYCSWYA